MLRDQVAIDAQYDLRTLVTDSTRHVMGWKDRSAAARERVPNRLDAPFGPTLDEHCDIFPATGSGRPIHVFFHGGYWKMLAARDFSFLAPVGTENGWATVVVNYSLCPKVSISEITRQARAALAWIWRNADSFGGDRNRIFVSGHSAGGHLVGRLTATAWEKDYGLPASLIAGALPISGLFDLEPIRWSWLQAGLQLTGDDILEESPMRHLPRVNIPTVVAVGGDESAEFLRQSQDYVTAMRDAGLRSEYLAIPGRHHFDILDDLAEADGALWSALNGLLKTADEATAAA